MEWTAGARKVAARRRKEEPEEQRLFLSPPGPHSQTINQTNRQEVGCAATAAATAAALFSPRRLPPLNVYCCCFIFLFFLCLFKYTLLRQLLWPSVSLNVWTFKSCFTTCHFGSTELFNWLVLQAGLFSKRLRYWHGKQEKSHTSSVAELALELPSAFHSVFTQIWCFNRRLLPVFGLENTFQRLCGLCVFIPSASSAATDRLLGGTFLSCAVLVQKTTRPRQRLPRQTTIFALFIDTFAFVILQQPPCSIIQDDCFFCFLFLMNNEERFCVWAPKMFICCHFPPARLQTWIGKSSFATRQLLWVTFQVSGIEERLQNTWLSGTPECPRHRVGKIKPL